MDNVKGLIYGNGDLLPSGLPTDFNDTEGVFICTKVEKGFSAARYIQTIIKPNGSQFVRYYYSGSGWNSWVHNSYNIPTFYKNYSDLTSLASALRVNPPIIGDFAYKDSGSVKLNANYGNTYHVYITKYVSGADQLILGEYLVSFGNSGYLITLKEKTGELSTVNIENDGTVTATFSSEGYYRIRCLKR